MYATLGGFPVRKVVIPFGDGGTWATVNAMRQLARAAARNPAFQLQARTISAGGNPHTLRGWLAQHWTFQRDSNDQEEVWAPAAQLARIARDGRMYGDCDDAATLGAALALAAGITPVKYVLYGFGPRPTFYTHIFATAGNVELDITRPHQEVPTPTRVTRVEV